MRNQGGAGTWLRERWLEIIMLIGLAGILAWFASVGYGLVPKPTPTPVPEATRVATETPTARPTATPTIRPRRRPTLTPTPTASPTITATAIVTGMVKTGEFDGDAAYRYVVTQADMGPRPAGSDANRELGDNILAELARAGWKTEAQDFSYMSVQARNIIGRAGKGPVVIVGAHYDTRMQADNDPDPARRAEPVIGANDGASGTAVLLELAQKLDKARLTNEVWLVFFDAADNGGLNGWDFLVGSRYMAEHLQVVPQYVVIADMIGDADQQIYKERSSSVALQDQIWTMANKLELEDYFLPEPKWTITDDHTPFLEQGIPAVDLIDFDYPYWQTTQDTADKVSADSLEHVGAVLQALLEGR